MTTSKRIDISAGIFNQVQAAERKARAHISRGEFTEAAKQLRLCHRLMQQYAEYSTGDTVRRMRMERAEQYLAQAAHAEAQARRGDAPTPIAAMPERTTSSDHQLAVEALITRVNVGWDDIGGLEETKEAIRLNYALGLVQYPEGVQVQPTRRLLFYGPPGTGKTMLAAAISKELDATFFNARIPDLLSQYFGESSKLISALYATAAVHAPAVIFLDELDALGRQRGGGQESGAERRVLNTLLSELDGLHNKGNDAPFVLTIGATNMPWELDRAILSRFGGGRIYVPLPDAEARRAILRIYVQGRGHNSEVGEEEWIERTAGYSGRELEQVVNHAVQRMLRRANPGLADRVADGADALRKYQLTVQPLDRSDFETALARVKLAVSAGDVEGYERWDA